MKALRLWLFAFKHWVAAGWWFALSEMCDGYDRDRCHQMGRAHEMLGDTAADEIIRLRVEARK